MRFKEGGEPMPAAQSATVNNQTRRLDCVLKLSVIWDKCVCVCLHMCINVKFHKHFPNTIDVDNLDQRRRKHVEVNKKVIS